MGSSIGDRDDESSHLGGGFAGYNAARKTFRQQRKPLASGVAMGLQILEAAIYVCLKFRPPIGVADMGVWKPCDSGRQGGPLLPGTCLLRSVSSFESRISGAGRCPGDLFPTQ